MDFDINSITVLGGFGRNGEREPVARVELGMGQMISVVGPTGSGKTALINDIGLFADGGTPSRRLTLVNGAGLPPGLGSEPSKNPISLITQHTNFLSDLPVRKFLDLHARIRQGGRSDLVEETVGFANELTGEPIIMESAMTELSGGQTRALLIADAVVIGNSPVILLDEIENAGIDRIRALELLRKYRKIFIFVTHDLRTTLLSDFRIVMGNGAMLKVIETTDEERRVAAEIMKIDDLMLDLRRSIRAGGSFDLTEFRARMRAVCPGEEGPR